MGKPTVWPFIIKKIKSHKYQILLLFIALYLFVNVALHFLPEFTYKDFLIIFWEDHFNIDCMVIGALFALIYFNKETRILKCIYDKYFQLLVFIITPLLMMTGYKFIVLNYEIYAVLFGTIIINLATNPSVILNIEHKWLNSLGKISYGIYMYHPIIIVIAIITLKALDFTYQPILYVLAIGFTLLMSYLSYHLFEKKLLKVKLNYSKVISGEGVKGP